LPAASAAGARHQAATAASNHCVYLLFMQYSLQTRKLANHVLGGVLGEGYDWQAIRMNQVH
jgi:hypothetical protein